MYAEEEEGSYLTNARFVQIHLPSNTVGKQFLSRHDATSSDYAQQKQQQEVAEEDEEEHENKTKVFLPPRKVLPKSLRPETSVGHVEKSCQKRERVTPKSETPHPPPTAIAVKSLRREGKRADCGWKKFGNSRRSASAYKYDVIYGIRSCFATCQNEIEHAAPTTRTN